MPYIRKAFPKNVTYCNIYLTRTDEPNVTPLKNALFQAYLDFSTMYTWYRARAQRRVYGKLSTIHFSNPPCWFRELPLFWRNCLRSSSQTCSYSLVYIYFVFYVVTNALYLKVIYCTGCTGHTVHSWYTAVHQFAS